MKYIYIPVYARNVWFGEFAESKLKSLVNRGANPNVKKWIKSNLRNWLIKEAPLDKVLSGHVKEPDTPQWVKDKFGKETIYIVQQRDVNNLDKIPVEHVIDYLNNLTHNVSNMSVPEVLKQVREWDKKLDSKSKSSIQEDDIEIVKEYPNGFKWVDIKGEKSLKREGELMGHCVGGSRYYTLVKSGKTKIFSLRDKEGLPCVTLEYYVPSKRLYQIKGPKNRPPEKRYRQFIEDIVNMLGVHDIESQDLARMGCLFDIKDKKLVPISKKEDSNDLVTISEIAIYNNGDRKIYLPNIISKRDVFISDTVVIGKDITTGGEIWIISGVIDRLGKLTADIITIEKTIVQQIGRLTSHEVNLSCDSSLDTIFSIQCDIASLRGNGDNFYQLADSTIKSLYLNNTELVLGDNVSIRYMDFENSEITELGENNTLPKLDLFNSDRIDNIPNGFTCKNLVVDLFRLPSVDGKPRIDTLSIKSDFDPEFDSKESLDKSVKELPDFLNQISYKELTIDKNIADAIKTAYPKLNIQ